MARKAFAVLFDLREKEVEEASVRVAKSRQEVNKSSAHLENLKEYFRQCHLKSVELIQQGMYSDQIKNQRGFIEKVRAAVDQASVQLDFQMKTLVKAEENLREALREAERIKTVIERDRKALLERMGRIEQKSMDEMAQNAFSRRLEAQRDGDDGDDDVAEFERIKELFD
jgi:flagellar export protein FliJ